MKSSETKKKCPYVERDISWMYFNQRILLKLPSGSTSSGTPDFSWHLFQ